MRTPIDRIFKNTAEIEPRAFLHLFGSLRIDQPAEVRELGREIGLEAVHLDHLYEVRTPLWHGLRHFEFQTRYQTNVPQRLTDYDLYAYLRYKLPIYSTLVLPVQKYAPAGVPEALHTVAGGLTIDCQFTVIRMWELDPDEIFKLDRPPLLPFIPLVSGDRRDWNRAAEQIVETGDRSLASAFISLGGLRYDQTELEGLLEKVLLEELLKPDLIRHSSVIAPLIAQAEKEAGERGLSQGLSRGRIEEARRMLELVVAQRFPSLPIPPGIQAIADPARIESLLGAILAAATAAEAESAIRSATDAAKE